jgi:hypothetical protein
MHINIYQVQASMDGDNKVIISQLILQTQRGEVINVKGGSIGGGGSGTDRGGGRGKVIDVDGRVQ